MARSRADRCPGIVHPWLAEDGGLVRIRVPGGQVRRTALSALVEVAEQYGDGRVRTTGRANLQVRAMPVEGDRLAAPALAALERTGLLPSRAHDRVRNVLVSPLTGIAGGRADLRPLVRDLDALLLGDAALAELPGRFLFTLDDGRGDLADRHKDLGLVALGADRVQLRVGEEHAALVALDDAAPALVDLARDFLSARGTGPGAAWHVAELACPLTHPLAAPVAPEPGAAVHSAALPFGPVPGGEHVDVGDEGLDAATVAAWTAETVVITPWQGVLIPATSPVTTHEETP